MKVVKALAPAALFAVIFCAGANAEDSKASGPAQPEGVPAKEFKAKAGYCETCHGLSARGFIGTNPMPRTRGPAAGLYKEPIAGLHRSPAAEPRDGQCGPCPQPCDGRRPVQTFQGSRPAALWRRSERPHVQKGKRSTTKAFPSAEVPACESCHGHDAHGNDQFPRLAGQLYGYVIAKLANWSKERGQDPNNPDTSQVMAPIAEKLTKEQIAAVAAYVSDLK